MNYVRVVEMRADYCQIPRLYAKEKALIKLNTIYYL